MQTSIPLQGIITMKIQNGKKLFFSIIKFRNLAHNKLQIKREK